MNLGGGLWLKELKKVLDHRFIDVILIIVLGLLPLTWFKDDLIITGGDFDYPLNSPIRFLKFYFFAWNDHTSMGNIFSRAIPQIPYQLFLSFCDFLGLSLQTTEKILFVFVFTLGGLSMYYLSSVLLGNALDDKTKRIACLCAALFNMFNFYTLLFTWRMVSIQFFLYSFIPLILALYVRLLQTKRNKYIYFLLLTLFLSVSNFSNPTYLVIVFLPILSYLIYYLLVNQKEERLLAVKYTCIFFLGWILINFWWFLPIANSISDEFVRSASAHLEGSPFEVLKTTSSKAKLVEILRLWGYWPFYTDYLGDPYYTFSKTYLGWFFVLLSFIPPMLVFLPLFFKKNRPIITYFSMMTLIYLFLMKGVQAPFGEIFYNFLFSTVPLANAFRNSWEKFGVLVLLNYAFLFGLGVAVTYAYLKEKSKILSKLTLIILMALMFIIYAFPFWTGDVIYNGGKIYPSFHVKVPEYYNKADKWLADQAGDFRLFPEPYLENFFGYAMKWKHSYVGASPLFRLLTKPAITQTADELPLIIDGQIKSDSHYDITKLLGLLSVKYIVFLNDIDWSYHSTPMFNLRQKNYYRNWFLQQENINLEKSFGKLDFYKISDNYFLPHIYSASGITLVTRMPAAVLFMPQSSGATEGESDIELLPDILSMEDENIRSGIFFSSQNEQRMKSIKQAIKGYDFKEGILITQEGSKGIYLSPDIRTPVIEFKKINPTKYRIRVHNATEDFPLIFSESYHEGWKAYLAKPDKLQITNNKLQINSKIQMTNYKILDGNEEDQASLVKSIKLKVESQDEILRQAQNDNTYKILEGNEEDQATLGEVKEYIQKGIITVAGSEFISKIIKGTIQNNNLPDGGFYETWGNAHIPDDYHWVANGYANSWWISLDGIKKDGGYVQNHDGSIDFELVLEFWPQRLFYIGLFISGLTLISCVLYLMLHSKNRVIGSRSLSRAEEIASGTTSHRNGTVRNILLAIANKVRQSQAVTIPFHLSPNKGLIIWGGIFSASLAFGIFQLIKDKTSGGESYGVTFSMIAFVVFYSYLFRKWRPWLEKKFPFLETYLPERLCAPYIAFAMLLLLFCALLLVFQLNPLAEQAANLAYFFLVWGVIKEAHS